MEEGRSDAFGDTGIRAVLQQKGHGPWGQRPAQRDPDVVGCGRADQQTQDEGGHAETSLGTLTAGGRRV
jgi:hypothetical protein